MTDMQQPFWSFAADELLRHLGTSAQGLAASEAERRLAVDGPNRLRPRRKHDWLSLLLAQFKSPITLILIGAAVLSLFLHDGADAGIILVIVAISALLGFWQ